MLVFFHDPESFAMEVVVDVPTVAIEAFLKLFPNLEIGHLGTRNDVDVHCLHELRVQAGGEASRIDPSALHDGAIWIEG